MTDMRDMKMIRAGLADSLAASLGKRQAGSGYGAVDADGLMVNRLIEIIEPRLEAMCKELNRQADAWDRLLLDLEDRVGDGELEFVRRMAREAREAAEAGIR
jgi:hypothetical protein